MPRLGLPALLALSLTVPWPCPPAPPGPVVDDYHGTKVPDPYRWLEDIDSPATRNWIAAENHLASQFLSQLPQRLWFRKRLAQLWNYPRYGVPFKEGSQYFFTKNDGLQNQPVALCAIRLARRAAERLFDPNPLAADGTVALTAAAVSHDGRWLAYGIAAAGSHWTEFRVRDIATGRDTGDVLRWIKFSGPAWTRDSRGFFSSRFPEPAPGAGSTFAPLSHQRVYYHRLGNPQAQDRLIYELPTSPNGFSAPP